MKVKFINIASHEAKFYINPAYFLLKSFYLKHGQNPHLIEWMPQTVDMHDAEAFIDEMKASAPDVICFSVYIWNVKLVEHLAPRLKELLPDSKFIVGGPELDAQNDTKFFEQYPWVDYVVYGDGEQGFAQLLDHLVDPSYRPNFVNVITREGGYKKYPHRVFKFKEFKPFSPWLDLKEEFSKLMRDATSRYGRDEVWINYERVRGCPYDCAFCNWSSGLHHKINARTADWREEVDFLSKFGTTVKFTDANFGILKEDVEVLDYTLAKSKELDNGFNMFPRNFAKLHKDVVYEMLDRIGSENKYETELKVSLQDIDNVVLENIQRPEIPWEEHKPMIKKLADKYPDKDVFVELILGMPGTSVEKFKHQMMEFSEIPFNRARSYYWALIKNSPAYKEEYRKKHNLVTVPTWQVYKDIDMSIDEIVERIKTRNIGGYPITYETMVYSGDLSFAEVLSLRYYNSLYNEMMLRSKLFNKKTPKPILMKKALDELSPHIDMRAKLHAYFFEEFRKKHGYVLMAGRSDGMTLSYGKLSAYFLYKMVEDCFRDMP